VVPFPSKEELERMIAIHTITTRNKEGTLTFEEFVDDVQPIKVLEQVWVTVTKVPRGLRSFLPLWAVGSIIGATQKVDMLHLRATGHVRILVAVYDAKKIPKFADVCVGCSVYRLFFQPDEIAQQDGSDPEEDDLLSDEDDNGKEKDRSNPDFEMGEADPEKDPTAGQSQPPSQQPRNLNQKQASLFREALDLACDKLFDEISIKVMLEPIDETTRKHFTPLTHEELDSYNTLVDPTAKVLPSEVFFSPSPDPQVVAPINILQGEADGDEIGGIPISPTTSSSDICSSPASGPAAGGVLSALSAGGEVEAGGAGGAATCALAASIDSACANATASGDATDILLGDAAAPGGNCTAPGPGLPADIAAGDSLLEPAGSTTLEGVEHSTADQSGMKDLTPDSAILAEPGVPCLRRSKRVAAMADVHTLHKVELLAAKRNLESKGTSFTNFSDSHILSNLGRIGINLGTSDVAVIKNLEVERLVLCAKQNKVSPIASTVDSDDERNERLDAVLDHACGDLNENVLDTERDHILDLAPVQRKKKI
jgi:hypothetical protein